MYYLMANNLYHIMIISNKTEWCIDEATVKLNLLKIQALKIIYCGSKKRYKYELENNVCSSYNLLKLRSYKLEIH